MIFSSSICFLCFIVGFLHADDPYHLGVINHHIQWHISCPQSSSRILSPPINNQPLISYQCPYGSLPINVIPIEIDLTFICRSESRLIWIIVDVYQFNDWLWSNNVEQMNITIELNERIAIKDWKSEVKNYQNRLIMINAFFIPFESLDNVLEQSIEITIRINQCQLDVRDNSTWKDIIEHHCQAKQSKTLFVQSARCQFTPKPIPIETTPFNELTTDIPDFHVILSVDDESNRITTSSPSTQDYYLLFNEHYKNLFSTLTILIRASNLLPYIFIFTLIIFILLVTFFIYVLCYHYHTRSKRRQSSSSAVVL